MKIYLGILFLIITALPAGGRGQANEYVVKAVFVERFTRFVEWPENSGVQDTVKPFIISVIGKNPFNKTLESLYSKQKIKNKKVLIKEIQDIGKNPDCNLLFISESAENKLDDILKVTRNKPILTIVDSEDYAKKGFLISFYLADGKVRFQINEDSVRKTGLQMSYRLLQMAKIVKEGEL